MLSYNSADTIGRALESVAEFAEVLVADGGSTDGTRDLVRRSGRTLVEQPDECRDAIGKLVDFGAARDALRRHATQPWVMQLDSDEYFTPELVSAVREVTTASNGGPTHYMVPARYEYQGRIVDCATTYPWRRLRLFRNDACTGYVGVTDERAVVSGECGEMDEWFVVPYAHVPLMLRKWLHYLRLDGREGRTLEYSVLRARSAHHKSSIRWFLRDFRKKRTPECHNSLPVYLELFRLAFYSARYVVTVRERARRRIARAGLRQRASSVGQ